MTRYWIKFDITLKDSPPVGILPGVGVTAQDFRDAKELVCKIIFKGEGLPEIKEYLENVDIQTLDSNHVLTNMGNPAKRGIWFPLGYS